MVTNIDIIMWGNIITVIIALPALLVNAKYYLEFRYLDNLILTLWFLFLSLQLVLVGVALNGQFHLFFWVDITNSLHMTAMFLLAMRIKWQRIPKISIIFLPLYLWHFGAALITTDFADRVGVMEPQAVPYLELITNIFLLYALLTTSVYINMENNQKSKNFWLIGTSFHVLGILIADIAIWTGNDINPFIAPQTLVLAILIPQYIRMGLFSYLHAWFPEAIIFSKAHLVRVKSIYKFVEEPKTDTSSPLDKMRSYLESIPQELLAKVET